MLAAVLGASATDLAVGILATLGKHLVATDRWHVFNPAALALLASGPLFGTGQSWWGALPDLGWPFVQATLFLALFMLTDPPTAPSRYADQVVIGLLVAAASLVAKTLGAGQAYLLGWRLHARGQDLCRWREIPSSGSRWAGRSSTWRSTWRSTSCSPCWSRC
jgi:hypothetical protein